MAVGLEDILKEAVRIGASDIHLCVNTPPAVRVNGSIKILNQPALKERALQEMLLGVLDQHRRKEFTKNRQLCFSWQVPRLGYFRFNLYTQLGSIEASIRIGRFSIPKLSELGVPQLFAKLADKPHGLILVTGPTGSGKTTTLNSLLGQINKEHCKKIITIEDPVEFIHPHGKSLLVQQEIGLDVDDFESAIVHALRQDPDIICIGELRGLETIGTALTAAETGHLVFGTLHTVGSVGTINRVIDVFPGDRQQQVRVQLASTLQAVLSQVLLPSIDGKSRVLVYELLVVTPAIRALIREGKVHQIQSAMQTGAESGIVLLDQMIREAFKAGKISKEVAVSAACNPKSVV